MAQHHHHHHHIGVPLRADMTYQESPQLSQQPYRQPIHQHHQHQPRVVHKTSSLPLQSPSSPLPNSPYYYYGGSNRSSTIESHTPLDNLLNLSQDSGLSPSPLEHPNHYSGSQIGVYDNYRKFAPTPVPQVNKPTTEANPRFGRWPFVDFFRRKSVSKEVEDIPPPLPPKKRTNVFRPTLLVKPGESRPERPTSVPAFGSSRSWKQERETAMLRAEAQRNSLILSSDEENELASIKREIMSQSVVPARPQLTHESLQKNRSMNRVSVTDLCHIPEMREPFPAELDFFQITHQMDYNPHVPPPPPPRDPHRKSFLMQGPSPQSRPVSYSFENLPVHRLFRSPVPEPPDLGVPHPVPYLPLRALHKNFSTSEQQLSLRSRESTPSQIKSPVLLGDSNCHVDVPLPKRGPRSASLSNCNRSAAPYSPVTVANLVNAQTSRSEPRQEYWKSPPPPFVPCPEPKFFSECLQNGGAPMRPKQQWKSLSIEDPILLLQGKSSPSSGSLTSRDSGCSEPMRATPLLTSEPSVPTPLPMVVEKSESIERDIVSDPDDDDESIVVGLRRESLPPSSPCSSSSPVRSGQDQPGFSCRKRRSLFRDAMCELEDAIKVIQSDTDLLDRAERRDLPTAHQELIVRSRIEEALRKKSKPYPFDDTATTSLNTSAEMAFSDMDNFMNWNTSSSFENLEERGFPPATSTPLRQRTPSRRRSAIPDKKSDDMAYRICKANNRTPPALHDPVVVSGQSYLLLSPTLAQTLLGMGQRNTSESDEPDPITDDVHLRSLRDSLLLPKVSDVQLKFGIPNGPIVASSNNDYLHAVPTGKYKSTFNAMKNPDTFLDDLAVRNLRKDDSRTEPELLGIYKDPTISTNSCWQHKLTDRLKKRPTSPLLFYPSKNNKLMQALSQRIASTIRKQSGRASGGKAEQIVTYDELLKDPGLMRAMREALLQCTEEELEEMSRRPTWSGKTIFELLSAEREESKLNNVSKLNTEHNSTEVIVGHCKLEHDVSSLKISNENTKLENGEISSNLANVSTSFLRAMERGDSGEEEQLKAVSNLEENLDKVTKLETRESERSSSEHPGAAAAAAPRLDEPLAEIGAKCQDVVPSSDGDRKKYLGQSVDSFESDPRRSSRQTGERRPLRRRTRRRDDNSNNDISVEEMSHHSTNSMESGGQPTASERRMAKYKEERRRQLASQIASRLSSARSSSSSDDNEDENPRFGTSGGESAGSGGGNGHSKYRRHRSKRTGEKEGSLLPGGSPSDKSGVKLIRRRRRRSLNGGSSPSPAIRPDKIPPVERLSAFLGDADGEDEGLDRDGSPEHIYQRIDEDDLKSISSRSDAFTDRVYRAVPASASDPKKSIFPSDRKLKPEMEAAGSRTYITTHQPTRVPRKYSLPKEPVTNMDPLNPLRSGRETSLPKSTGSSSQENNNSKRSLLNTSYSSEELLFQAVSSLQGLEEEFNSTHHSRHRPPSGGQPIPVSASTANTLSSPEMIKTLARTLTPPVSPFHQLRSGGPNGERKSPSAQHPDSEASSTVSSSGTSVPISDPLIDSNWPGRPKRNGPPVVPEVPRLRKASPVLGSGTGQRSSSRGSSETDLTINVAAASEAAFGPGSGNSSTPSTSGKPPIFPSPERTPTLSSRSSQDLNRPPAMINDDVPAFIREFAARRRSNNNGAAGFNPNEPAPPPPTPTKRTKAANALAARPHSAFIPRNQSTHKRTSFELEPEAAARTGPVPSARRKSDFLTRYENLMHRAQAAMQAVDNLDFEKLNHRQDLNSEDEQECVEFNEEEVLKKCQDFLKDYDKSKQRRSLDVGTVTPPVPKPRQLFSNTPEFNDAVHKPSLRTRSSSLTIHDKRSNEENAQIETDPNDDRSSVRTVLPKPILKKSSEDLKPVPILKNRFDSDIVTTTTGSSSTSSAGSVAGGILKRKSVTDSGNETTASRPDHVRIRSPSPDLSGSDDDDDNGDRQMSRRPILRSRKISAGDDRASSPDYPQSILKRRSSQEDIDDGSAGTSGATSRSSPEPPHGILKRKLSVGSLGSHSPEGSLGSFSSILRKKSHSQHSSCQGSLEDLSCEGEKIRSILKKRSTVSTDDELVETFHDRPKSILKGRRSEESLSPLSDPCDFDRGARYSRDSETMIRPILKQRDSRDEFSPVHETRDKSASPSRGAAMSPPEASEVMFSGSTGFSTPMRRSSLPVSPRRQRANGHDEHATLEDSEESPARRSSFVSKASVFIDASDIRSPQRASRISPLVASSADQGSGQHSEGLESEDRDCPSPVSGGILRRQGSANSRTSAKEDSLSDVEGSNVPIRKRSILKHDSLELISDVGRIRGVLKKDSSYDETMRRPILKNNFDEYEDAKSSGASKANETSSNTSSSEDLDSLLGANRAFSRVVIDPVPGVRKSSAYESDENHHNQQDSGSDDEKDAQQTRKSPVKSRKSSLVHPRQPVIPPSSVKISADGNLADQLECVADRAEAELKKIMNQETRDREMRDRETIVLAVAKEETKLVNNNNKPIRMPITEKRIEKDELKLPKLTRTISNDVSAKEYYAIYQKSKEEAKLKSEKKNQSGGTGVERKGSFSLKSPRDSFASNHSLSRSKSFTANARVNHRNSDESLTTSEDIPDEAMLEQSNPRQQTEIKVTGGIAERLAALKKSGEEEWKKKIPKFKKDDPLNDALANNKLFNKKSDGNESAENDKNNEKNGKDSEDEMPTLRRGRGVTNRLATNLEGAGGRPVSLVERLSQLQTAQSSWQAKVGEKDAEKFTVAGKMQKIRGDDRPASMMVTPSGPMTTPTTPVSRSRTMSQEQTPGPDSGDDKDKDRVKKTPKPRRFYGSPPPHAENGSYEDHQDEANTPSYDRKSTMDEGVEQFFSRLTNKTDERLDCSVSDFDFIVPSEESNLIHFKKSVPRLANRRQKGSRNPVKHLSNRSDLRQVEFDDFPDEVLDHKEEVPKTPSKTKDSVHAHLAAEALAGLASKEDFSNVHLRKNNTTIPHQDMVPYKSTCMLLQVKGRRTCQTRLVNPCSTSINSGDAYVLVTPRDIFNWVGEFSNVIERSRSAEIAATILQKKDLGCKAARRVITIEEEKVTPSHSYNKQFWKILGCSEAPEKVNKPGPPEEDEEYEVEINDLNLVWTVNQKTSELIPEEPFWGAAPKYELLEDTTRVLVLDFGSEVYVWNGRNAPFETRRLGTKLAKDLWEKGIEETAPVADHPLIPAGTKRPDWALLGKVNQNMETILFREKFLNWPDKSRLIKPAKESTTKKKVNAPPADGNVKLSTDVEKNFDIADIVAWTLEEPNLELEMTFLGRGRSYYDEADRRQYEIETLSTKVWHVSEHSTVELDPEEFKAQFYFEDTYVVRWKYKVSLTGRDLKGRPSKHVAVGRERWAYLFWQGCESGVTEKGASALMTVELDRERGPHIRVVQGREPAAFLNLWSGNMVVHLGRRGETRSYEKPRLYVVRGEVPEEGHCVEVDCNPSNLRSRGCFVYVDRSNAHLWIGHGAPEHTKTIGKKCAERLSAAIKKSLVTEHEGSESETLRRFVGDRTAYVSMLKPLHDSNASHSTRLYFMSSVSGDFQVNEVSCPFLSSAVPNLMPFNQSELYSVEQPAIFLVDAGGECLWLWQGWWPDVGHDVGDTNLCTGSGMIRWHAERRLAMQTTVEYRDAKYSSRRPNMKLVWAGHEPDDFTNLFPTWTQKEEVKNLNQKYVAESHLEFVLAALSKSTYTWQELKQKPLPDGVDPARLENYLSDEDFVKYLGLSREEFSSAPKWKQLKIRQEKGLF